MPLSLRVRNWSVFALTDSIMVNQHCEVTRVDKSLGIINAFVCAVGSLNNEKRLSVVLALEQFHCAPVTQVERNCIDHFGLPPAFGFGAYALGRGRFGKRCDPVGVSAEEGI